VAWKKFFALKQELTGHRYSLTDRLRLFHGTITPTILYASEAWTLTTDLEHRLRRTQRQMIRMILHAPRRKHHNENTTLQQTQHPTPPQTPRTEPMTPSLNDSDDSGSDADSSPPTPHKPPQPDDDATTDLEPWVDWIRRCTHEAETRMKKLKLDDWVTIQRRRKWRWAHKLATNTNDTWTTTALQWDPTLDNQLKPRRRAGRPKTRWTDDIREYIQQYKRQLQDDTTCPDTTTQNNDHDHNINNALVDQIQALPQDDMV